MLAHINRSKEVLNIVVFNTRNDKQGIYKIVWPPLFRGIEEPDEFYPSVAFAKLQAKFYLAHPQPFRELKKVYKLGVLPEAMDFLESPLRGRLEGLLSKEEAKAAQRLEDTRERMDHFVFHHFGTIVDRYTAQNRSNDLEDHLSAKKEYDKKERELGMKYCGWLAKQCGQGTKSNITVPDPAPAPASIELDCLRRDEIIVFSEFSLGYGTKEGFDMGKANRKAFLSLYEQSSECEKGSYVLIAYGREIVSGETLEKVSAVAERLKLLESECLKAKLDRETFLKLAK